MVDPVIVGGAVTAAGIAAAAGYAYFTGNDASAGVDIDNDGEDEADFEFEGGKESNIKVGDKRADGIPHAIEVGGETKTPHQVDPTPEVVEEKDGLTDIKGIGPSRAEAIGKAGFSRGHLLRQRREPRRRQGHRAARSLADA